MPNYDFQCDLCAHVFERLLPMVRRNDTQACPACPAGLAEKIQPTAPGTSFKGSGWTPKWNNRGLG